MTLPAQRTPDASSGASSRTPSQDAARADRVARSGDAARADTAPEPDDAARSDDAVRLDAAAAGRCRRRVHLDHDPDADRARRLPPSPGLALRRAALAEHRRAVCDRLGAVLDLDTDWHQGDTRRPAAIWSPRLTTATRTARPELLLRAADGGYLPILVRGHRTTNPGRGALVSPITDPAAVSAGAVKLRSHHADVLALAHVYRMLVELGLSGRAARGGIIGRGTSSTDPGHDDADLIVWHDLRGVLAEYDAAFTDRLAVARAAAERRPALAQPSRISECRRCPWWSVCGPQLEAAHDVSLLAAGPDIALLRDRGLTTYDDVAALDDAAAATLPLTSIPAATARIRARAMAAGAPLVRRTAVVEPVRAAVELDVDMESYSDDGAYLWGTYLTGNLPPGFEPGYRPFVTWEPLDSDAAATNFVDFWRYVTALRSACVAAGRTFAAYCYSHQAEERWLYGTPTRFADQPGMPTRREIGEFCSSPQWVDLYLEVKRCFVVPGSMRLKKVATVAGFSWRDAEPGGENSMAWYRLATGAAPDGRDVPAAEVAANRERILRYNEDDVIATLRLREWMTERSDAMPTVADLDGRVWTARS